MYEESGFEPADDNPSPEEQFIESERQSEIKKQVHKALRQLNPRQQAMVQMVFFEDKSQDEVAEYFGISKQAVSMATKSDLYAGLTNAYRTRYYIVFQEIGLCDDEEMGTFLFSVDGYYRRTKQRDADYERRFRKRKDVDGQRIPVGTYIREYVD